MRGLLFWLIALLLVGTLVVVTLLPGVHRPATTQPAAPIAQTSSAPTPSPSTSTSSPAAKVSTESDTPVATNLDAIRRSTPINQEATPLPMARVENNDIRRERAYPMQPPTIPHSIDNYEVDKNNNRCLMCHTRTNAAKFQAPAISVTHYLDREGHVLAQISPRRYFCIQCHVPQTDAKPLVGNTFQDEEAVIKAQAAKRNP